MDGGVHSGPVPHTYHGSAAPLTTTTARHSPEYCRPHTRQTLAAPRADDWSTVHARG